MSCGRFLVERSGSALSPILAKMKGFELCMVEKPNQRGKTRLISLATAVVEDIL
jgi:hypothetical protein